MESIVLSDFTGIIIFALLLSAVIGIIGIIIGRKSEMEMIEILKEAEREAINSLDHHEINDLEFVELNCDENNLLFM